MKGKKIFSVLFILALMLPPFAFSPKASAVTEEYVTVSFEDFGKRVGDGGDFPVALGVIVDETKVKIQPEDTIARATLRLLSSKGITPSYTGSPEMGGNFYLEAIDNFITRDGRHIDDGYGLGEFSAGTESGWMVSYNSRFIDKSASDFYVRNGDVICWQFTASGYGRDIGGGADSSSDAKSAERAKSSEEKILKTEAGDNDSVYEKSSPYSPENTQAVSAVSEDSNAVNNTSRSLVSATQGNTDGMSVPSSKDSREEETGEGDYPSDPTNFKTGGQSKSLSPEGAFDIKHPILIIISGIFLSAVIICSLIIYKKYKERKR